MTMTFDLRPRKSFSSSHSRDKLMIICDKFYTEIHPLKYREI